MGDDETRGGRWGPWALVAGVGAVGLLGLARELRDRRRAGNARDEASGEATDAGSETDTTGAA